MQTCSMPCVPCTKTASAVHILLPSVDPHCAVQDVAKAGQIIPAVTIAWLLASAGTAALYGLVWLISSCFHIASRKSTKTAKPRSPFISSMLWPLLGFIFGYTPRQVHIWAHSPPLWQTSAPAVLFSQMSSKQRMAWRLGH